jgi:hypothetical protein
LLKPQELITFGIFLLGAKRYKVLLAAIVTTLVLSGVAFLLMGADGFANYFKLFRTLNAQNVSMLAELSPTVRGQLMRFGVSESVTSVVSTGCLLIAVAASFIWGRVQSKSNEWLENGLVVTLPLGLITAFLAHYYDLVLLLPVSVALITSRIGKSMPEYCSLIGLLGLMVFMLPASLAIHYGWLLTNVSVINPFFVVLLVATFVICAYAVKSVRRAGVDEASS